MNILRDSLLTEPSSLSLIPVVLCGGSGTRLWPLSRQAYPKQFLRLNGGASLLQQTIQRLPVIDGIAPPMLVCSESSRFVAAEQVRELGIEDAEIILEPMQRNTAPAIAIAALRAISKGDDALLLVLPSDHMIKDRNAFHTAIFNAKKAAEDGDLVTFGITPTAAETGYGYIHSAEPENGRTGYDSVQPVLAFVEKPNRQTAEQFILCGSYYWNSGMFLFRASRYLEELERYQPEIIAACRKAMALAHNDRDFIRVDSDAYAMSPNQSIDYGVMEHTTRASMVAMEAGWSDVGCWTSVWDTSDKDDANNATQGDVVLQDCDSCLVHGTTRLITAVGLRNTIIVETADALLVMGADCAQDTKELVNQLIDAKRPEAVEHREVFRPWGSYDGIGHGKRFQVKRITVKPHARLSLQMHHHRAEHWVVVSGTAKITNGDREYLLTENQSTYIPLGVVHSLENPGKIPLDLIEIQSGAYLGEDDIVRLQDNYGRAPIAEIKSEREIVAEKISALSPKEKRTHGRVSV